METVSEQSVVGPVRNPCTHCGYGDIVHQNHYHRKDRQRRPSVGDNPVDFIRKSHAALAFLGTALSDDGGDILITGIGDDALRVIIILLFQRGGFRSHIRSLCQLRGNLIVPLQ